MKFFLMFLLVSVACVAGLGSQCEEMAREADFRNRNTIVDTSLRLLEGTWISEGCETRPGPQYLLRNYHFDEDGTYKLIQHHYWDASCTSPKLTIISHGHIKLKKNAFLNPDAATGYKKMFNITLIPQDTQAARNLNSIVAKECPDRPWKVWRRYEEHLVYTHTESNHFYLKDPVDLVQNQPPSSSGHILCLSTLKWTFNELKLLKIQLKPMNNLRVFRMELLLGDIHPRAQDEYIPTAFQIPLVKFNEKELEEVEIGDKKYMVKTNCVVCKQVYGSEKLPPHLVAKAPLPPYIWGDWTSSKCEGWPMGLYLTRKFSFLTDDFVWIGEHKFYYDPFCVFSKFTITASGRFVLSTRNNLLKNAYDIDFQIEKATMVVFTKSMARDLDSTPSCGIQPWTVGEVQDLSPTGGCAILGVSLPSTQIQIVKVEMDHQGAVLLFLGQTDLENLPLKQQRPTAFQEPLVKCSEGKLPQTLEFFFQQSGEYNNGNLHLMSSYLLLLNLVLFY